MHSDTYEITTRHSTTRCSVIKRLFLIYLETDNSGFPSKRINLSPFTKDFRGGEQLNESFVISYRPTLVGHTIQSFISLKISNFKVNISQYGL